MTNGGRVPWNVTAICEMFRTDCVMAKHHMKGDLVNHPTDPCFILVQWSNITQLLPKTCHVVTNAGRKFCPECFSEMHCTRGKFWKGDIIVSDSEELENLGAP